MWKNFSGAAMWTNVFISAIIKLSMLYWEYKASYKQQMKHLSDEYYPKSKWWWTICAYFGHTSVHTWLYDVDKNKFFFQFSIFMKQLTASTKIENLTCVYVNVAWVGVIMCGTK